jgi:putative molybdopterin biosynthesis protein
MSYTYLQNAELEDGLTSYIEALKTETQPLGTEDVQVNKSYGRIVSEAVYAKISSPHYNACAMDGIALCARSTFGATETTPSVLREGIDFERVDTGDPLPDRFDAVVMIEDVIEAEDGTVRLLSAASPWQNIRQIGEDVCASEMIIPSNTRIEPPMIGAMLAGGVLRINVWRRPLVGLIPTGDEIVPPTSAPGKGDILEFNSSIFSAMLDKWSADTKVYSITPDKFDAIKDVIIKAAAECDVVIVNAGSSAGREDYSSAVITEIGRVILHGIAIRPGKPAILGIVNQRSVLGIPGYPVSGIIVMEKICKPVIEYMTHTHRPARQKANAVLSRKIVSSLKYKEFVRMKIGYVDGKFIATPLARGAGVITSFVKADGLLEIPINSEGIEAGTDIEVELLKSAEEIQNTLTVTGSHDPLIDIISDLLRKSDDDLSLSSAHVGSMGGIMAVKRGEAHIAGIHLLDEVSGEYNMSFIKRYLADEKILLIRGIHRSQGLMTGKNNPKNIQGLNNLTQEGISYVNRQKGSGTRILLDYLLKKENVSASSIYGYNREEFTHMSVAAIISSGSVDAGLGIFSAAKAFDLGFLPICDEEYDFIIPARFAEMNAVKKFLNVLGSAAFKAALSRMGGYSVRDPEITIV